MAVIFVAAAAGDVLRSMFTLGASAVAAVKITAELPHY